MSKGHEDAVHASRGYDGHKNMDGPNEGPIKSASKIEDFYCAKLNISKSKIFSSIEVIFLFPYPCILLFCETPL